MIVPLYVAAVGLAALFAAISCIPAMLVASALAATVYWYARRGHYLGVRRTPATQRGLWREARAGRGG